MAMERGFRSRATLASATVICLQSRTERLLVEELAHADVAAVLRIAQLGLVRLRHKVFGGLVPGEIAGETASRLRLAKHEGVLGHQRLRELAGRILQLSRRHGLIHELELSGLLSGEGLAG